MSNYPYIFSKAFATHLPHSFCYMFTFHSHICSYIWEATSCYIFAHVYTHLKTILCRTFIEKAIFVLLIHILERQFHIIRSYFEKHFHAIFNIYAHFAKHLATYSTYTCTWWTTFSHYLGTRKIWCSPNQALPLRGNLTNMLSHIMPSCISTNKSMPPLGLSHVLAFILILASCPHPKNGNHTYTSPI